jgi:hypothetical protein
VSDPSSSAVKFADLIHKWGRWVTSRLSEASLVNCPPKGTQFAQTSHLDQGPQGFSIYCPHLSRKFALMRDAMLVHFGVADFA